MLHTVQNLQLYIVCTVKEHIHWHGFHITSQFHSASLERCLPYDSTKAKVLCGSSMLRLCISLENLPDTNPHTLNPRH